MSGKQLYKNPPIIERVIGVYEPNDFRQFSVDRSPPRYQEGWLQSNKEKFIVVWHDGTRESLSPKAARALGDLNVGERFSAHVKLGKNDETIGLERVSLLGPASERFPRRK